MTVFCDWLDVTCHPDSSFMPSLYDWLSLRFPVVFEESTEGVFTKVVFEVGTGKLLLEKRNRFHRSSVSGGSLSGLREFNLFGDYLSLLSTQPHSVTRLDAAIDVAIDAPIILRDLEKRYPTDFVCLSRKALKVTRMYSMRSDLVQSGTWYVGRRSRGRVTARVYDKQLEAFENRQESLPPTTRYELTFKKEIGCTLRDAYMPGPLFYEFASPALLDRPDDVCDWVPHGEGWVSDKLDLDVTVQLYRRRVEQSPDVRALARLAAQLGPGGEQIATRIFAEQFQRALAALEESERASEGVLA